MPASKPRQQSVKKPARKTTAKRPARAAVTAAKTSAAVAREARELAAGAEAAAAEATGSAKLNVEEIAEDDPLLDTAVRQLEAQVDEEHPFGVPGPSVGEEHPFRIAFTATLGVLTALLLAKGVIVVRQVIVLLIVAAFLAIGLNPAVEWLQRRGLRRGLSVLAISVGFVLFLGGFFAAVVPPIARQGTELVKELPSYTERLQRDNRTFRRLDDRYHITEKIKAKTSGEGVDIQAFGGLLGVAKSAFNAVFSFFTVLVLTLYFLGNYPSIKRTAYRLVPRSRRARFGLIADEILVRVGGYVLGNLATSLVIGVTTFVFLLIVGVPYPLALALFVAIADLIPLVGATIGGVVTVAVAFFVSVPVGVATLAFYMLYQQFENYVLVPRVMKKTVDVSPLATIVAALTGAALLGVVGALLAIPVAAAIQLVGSEVVVPRQDVS
ncbi:MAG: AI-2E family transporter [Frankia sp.]|nr:AI-2E family transporter [Frankia sp.]